jgi:hypothetical protein
MKTSDKRPDSHPNDWPVADKNAFLVLVVLSKIAVGNGAGEIQAVHDASREIALEGGPEHWLVDTVLAGVFDAFFIRSGDHYSSADGLMRWGTADDLVRLGPGTVAWARELTDSQTDH